MHVGARLKFHQRIIPSGGSTQMRRLLVLLFLVPALLLAQQQNSLSGHWIFTADYYGTPIVYKLELQQQGDKLTGNFGGDNLEGTITGGSLRFHAKDPRGGWEDINATVHGDTMTGSALFAENDDPGRHQATHQFTARLVPQRRAGPPQHHEFTPTTFYRQ